MMPSPAASRTIQPAAVSLPATGRVAAGGAPAESFASLLGGETQAIEMPAVAVTAGHPPASDRQDDAAGGSAMPSTDPVLPASADVGWLAMILAGSAPAIDAAAPAASGQLRPPQPTRGGVTASNIKGAVSTPALLATVAQPAWQTPAPLTAAKGSFPPLQSFNDVATASVADTLAVATPIAAPVIAAPMLSLPFPPTTDGVAPSPLTLAPPAATLPSTSSNGLAVLPAAEPTTIALPVASTGPTAPSPNVIMIAGGLSAAPRAQPTAPTLPTAVRTVQAVSSISAQAPVMIPAFVPLAATATGVVLPRPVVSSTGFDVATTPIVAAPTDLAAPAAPGQPTPVALATALPAQAAVAPPRSEIGSPERAATTTTAPPAPSAVPAPASASLAPAPVAPAGQVFAAAIHAAGRAGADDARDADPIAAQQAASLAATASTPGAVTAASGRGDASLDMRRENWPSAMVDHIERLRDAANATDTSIRLVPDALGSIDVSLSRHDDGVRVSLAAHQPATQALLAEARPQLTELAQARGIRLTDAGGGTSGQGFSDAQRQPRIQAAMPSAPASAVTEDRDPADSRVA